ncbi:AAA-ATPase [Dichanthelium oligosanthes]|uniref:AAA-ATPase n=1 Tax=Dichanthelium oligosanthes TaxID=888268 RepID=A0A1E5VEW2_9POAL|nr:AAA-ATPase [Dichanthelium oligosanthes]
MLKHVAFKHPSTFDTLAMDLAKKLEIMDDLDAFRKGKDYYERIGKAWKRGYLLYGPPGTGKSSMIAAMANYLDYDIYDIELTSVASNTDLRSMFIDTKGKSIIVVEDIDCSLNLTGNRRRNKHLLPSPTDPADATTRREPQPEPPTESTSSKVTLSGLLNAIDGLWSACGGERVIVFTINHVEKLNPALVRRGRIDKHIEMSYCCFESFRFLARNYLAVDTHPLFDDVRALLLEVDITPADVAELLTPKRAGDDASSSLAGLVEALRETKEEAAAAAKNAGSDKVHEDEEEVEDE